MKCDTKREKPDLFRNRLQTVVVKSAMRDMRSLIMREKHTLKKITFLTLKNKAKFFEQCLF